MVTLWRKGVCWWVGNAGVCTCWKGWQPASRRAARALLELPRAREWGGGLGSGVEESRVGWKVHEWVGGPGLQAQGTPARAPRQAGSGQILVAATLLCSAGAEIGLFSADPLVVSQRFVAKPKALPPRVRRHPRPSPVRDQNSFFKSETHGAA